MKVKCDHRSKISNLSNWKGEAWKKSGLQRDSNPWPPRYRCDALPTELWSHTLGARSIYWVHIFPRSGISEIDEKVKNICNGNSTEVPGPPVIPGRRRKSMCMFHKEESTEHFFFPVRQFSTYWRVLIWDQASLSQGPPRVDMIR